MHASQLGPHLLLTSCQSLCHRDNLTTVSRYVSILLPKLMSTLKWKLASVLAGQCVEACQGSCAGAGHQGVPAVRVRAFPPALGPAALSSSHVEHFQNLHRTQRLLIGGDKAQATCLFSALWERPFFGHLNDMRRRGIAMHGPTLTDYHIQLHGTLRCAVSTTRQC